MIGLILKYWKLIIDILIVIALCIAFSYFDPFHMFRKTRLQPTANLISNVKSIGELVTAEYYGEVITDGKVSKIDYTIDYNALAHQFNLDLKIILENHIKNDDEQKIETYHLDTLRDDYDEFQFLITHITLQPLKKANNKRLIEKTKNKFRDGKFNWIQNRFLSGLNNVINPRKNFSKNAKSIEAYILVDTSSFSELYWELNNIQFEGKKAKEKIILIGRGTVKAGYDFGTLDETKFIYQKSKKRIRLYDFNAQILDTIINPWFIPELKIAGYEFVNNPKISDYSKVIEVKNKCRIELSNQAYNAGIIEQANIYGKEVLEQFFITLTNEPDLELIFEDLPYKELLNGIKKDGIIDSVESIKVMKLFNNYDMAFSSEANDNEESISNQKQIIIARLKKLNYRLTSRRFNLFDLEYVKFQNQLHLLGLDSSNWFHKQIACGQDSVQVKHYIINNDTIDINELTKRKIIEIRDTIRPTKKGRGMTYITHFTSEHKEWYSQSTNDTAFIKDFNSSLYLFMRHLTDKRKLIDLYKYPEWNIKNSYFDKVAFQDTLAIKKILNEKFNKIEGEEAKIIYQTELKKALDYVNSKPIKEFTHAIKNLFKK